MKKEFFHSKNWIFSSVLAVLVVFAVFFRLYFSSYFTFAKEMDLSFSQMWKVYGAPTPESEWQFSLIVEAEHGNWTEVARLTEEDRETLLGTYFHNIAMAKQGRLSQELLNYYQPFENGLFLPIKQGSRPLYISCAGESWYQLGEIILSEHATMLGLAFSPSQSGARFYRRLAQIAHINGDDASVAKYERLLGSPVDDVWKEKLPFVPKTDTVIFSGQNRLALLNLLESNPDNMMAYEYLLCYSLLRKDIATFIEDYQPGKVKSKLYDEAVIVYLAGDNQLTKENLDKYGVSKYLFNDFRTYCDFYMAPSDESFEKLQTRFGNSYWFYFNFAGNE